MHFNVHVCLYSSLSHTCAYILHYRTRVLIFFIIAHVCLYSSLSHTCAYILHYRTRVLIFFIIAHVCLYSSLPHTCWDYNKRSGSGELTIRKTFNEDNRYLMTMIRPLYLLLNTKNRVKQLNKQIFSNKR